ncbi:MAG: hypothetical protein AAB955_02705 [Patescibacteria group bacterium]|mgnify:CR=1 FL=1
MERSGAFLSRWNYLLGGAMIASGALWGVIEQDINIFYCALGAGAVWVLFTAMSQAATEPGLTRMGPRG